MLHLDRTIKRVTLFISFCACLTSACTNHVNQGNAQQVPQVPGSDPLPAHVDEPALVPPEPPQNIPLSQASVGSDWVVKFVAPSVPHGLHVSGSGSFRIGPTPEGQVVTGNLEPVELKALKELLAREWNGPVTGELMVRAETRELHEELTVLAAKYVPDQFPHPCFDAVKALRELQLPLRQCKMAADCAYIDELLQPIASGVNANLLLDDCTYLDVIPVANAFETVASQRDLILARELTTEICGTHLTRKSCARPVKIRTKLTHPICLNGECRLSPDLIQGEL